MKLKEFRDFNGGLVVALNPDHIVSVQEYHDKYTPVGTKINMSNGIEWLVKEDVEDVVAQINGEGE